MRSLVWLPLVALAVLAPQAVRSAPRRPEPDSRLRASTRLMLAEVPLSDLFRVLEKRTGVRHVAADTATGDLQVSLYGGLTLAQLHQALEDVLMVEWEQKGQPGAYTYTARRTPRSVALQAETASVRQRLRKESLRKLLAEAEQPPKDPGDGSRSRLLDSPRVRGSARVMGKLDGDLLSRVAAGGSVRVPLASLSPEAKERLGELLAMPEALPPNAPPNSRRPQSNPRDGDGMLTLGPSRITQAMAGKFGIDWRFSAAGQPLTEGGFALPGMGREGFHDFESRHLPIRDIAGAEGDRPIRLTQPIVPRAMSWDRLLALVEGMTGHAMVSDAYRFSGGIMPSQTNADAGEPLALYFDRILEGTSSGPCKRWGRVGPVFTFQSRTWEDMREKQLPLTQVRKWQGDAVRTGRFTLEDVVEMGSLPPVKQVNLQNAVGQTAEAVAQHYEILTLWHDVPARWREQGEKDGALVRDLPLPLQRSARRMIVGILRTGELLVVDRARLRVEKRDDAFVYRAEVPEGPKAEREISLTVYKGSIARWREDEVAWQTLLDAAGGGGA